MSLVRRAPSVDGRRAQDRFTRGILHSEKNDSWRIAGEAHRDPVHFVQMWVVPDETRHREDPLFPISTAAHWPS